VLDGVQQRADGRRVARVVAGREEGQQQVVPDEQRDVVHDVALLVRHHLLLSLLATGHDPSDPATVCTLLDAVEHRPGLLAELRVLTEADTRSVGGVDGGPQGRTRSGWTPWRARLVDHLVARATAAVGAPERAGPG